MIKKTEKELLKNVCISLLELAGQEKWIKEVTKDKKNMEAFMSGFKQARKDRGEKNDSN